MTAKAISIPRAQFNWYLRNALMSEARDDLLKALRAYASNVAVVRVGGDLEEDFDEDLETDERKRPPAPAPGTAKHAELVRRLTLRLSPFVAAPEGREPYEANIRYAAEAFSLAELETEILRLVLRTRRNASLRDFANEACRVLDDVPRALSAMIGAAMQEVEVALAPDSRLLTCGVLTYDPDSSHAPFLRYGGLQIPDAMRIPMCIIEPALVILDQAA